MSKQITLSKIEYPDTIKSILMQDNLAKSILGKNINIFKWIPDLKSCAFFSVRLKNEIIGIFILQDMGDKVINFHGGLYKKYRGKNTVHYLKKTLKIVKKLLPEFQFITTVPVSNKLAIKLDEAAGFKLKQKILVSQVEYLVYTT